MGGVGGLTPKNWPPPWTILDPAIEWGKGPFIYFRKEVIKKASYLSIFWQKHSILVFFSVFTPFVHQKGSLFYCEMVMLQSSWPPLRRCYLVSDPPVLKKFDPSSEFTKLTPTLAKISCPHAGLIKNGCSLEFAYAPTGSDMLSGLVGKKGFEWNSPAVGQARFLASQEVISLPGQLSCK